MAPSPPGGCTTIDLSVQPLTAEAFAPFGQVIAPAPDDRPFGSDDAQLDLRRGTPRFYIMSLAARPAGFRTITRHVKVTQCLASCGAKPWVIAVAPPEAPDDPDARPDPRRIAAFRVPGTAGIKLERGTWHAGPFFSGTSADFFNLELSDTNETDHHSIDLAATFGVEFRLAGM